jgi:hypothetical protein
MRRILLAVSCLALALVGAPPATAATISDYQAEESVSAGTQGYVQADCPDGQRALGGGVVSSGAYDSSYVNATYPEDGQDAKDRRDDAWRTYVDALSNVDITARVVCLDGKAAKSLKYLREIKHVPEGGTRSVRASCPQGYKVTGGGLSNSGVFDEAEVKGTRPVDRNTAWEGTVRNISTHTEKIFVDVVCARGAFAKGLKYRDENGKADPHTQSSVATDCPGGGTATGAGVLVKRAASNVNTVITTDDSSQAYVDATGSKPVRFTNYVICHG